MIVRCLRCQRIRDHSMPGEDSEEGWVCLWCVRLAMGEYRK